MTKSLYNQIEPSCYIPYKEENLAKHNVDKAEGPTNFFIVPHEGREVQVTIDNLIMISAASNYSTLYISNGTKIFTSKTLKYWYERMVDKDSMLRIHHSHLVNKNYIQVILPKERTVVLSTNMSLPCSRRNFKALKITQFYSTILLNTLVQKNNSNNQSIKSK